MLDPTLSAVKRFGESLRLLVIASQGTAERAPNRVRALNQRQRSRTIHAAVQAQAIHLVDNCVELIAGRLHIPAIRGALRRVQFRHQAGLRPVRQTKTLQKGE